jgi:hypothetical protein
MASSGKELKKKTKKHEGTFHTKLYCLFSIFDKFSNIGNGIWPISFRGSFEEPNYVDNQSKRTKNMLARPQFEEKYHKKLWLHIAACSCPTQKPINPDK